MIIHYTEMIPILYLYGAIGRCRLDNTQKLTTDNLKCPVIDDFQFFFTIFSINIQLCFVEYK